jgi:hypothetical protein
MFAEFRSANASRPDLMTRSDRLTATNDDVLGLSAPLWAAASFEMTGGISG